MWALYEWAYRYLTAEWLLDHHPNGGAVVLARSGIVAALLYLLFLTANNLVDSKDLTLAALRGQILQTARWFGAFFVGVYTALYANFSSQWTYLAGVYNQIKATQCRGGAGIHLSQWKAGFIEDALHLHLAMKPGFAEAVRAWADDKEVREAFYDYVDDGEARLDVLMRQLDKRRKSASGAPPLLTATSTTSRGSDSVA